MFLLFHRAPTPEMAPWAVLLLCTGWSQSSSQQLVPLKAAFVPKNHKQETLFQVFGFQGSRPVSCIKDVSRMLAKIWIKYKFVKDDNLQFRQHKFFGEKQDRIKKKRLCVKKIGDKERNITFKGFIVSYETMLNVKLHRSEINSGMKTSKIGMLVCFQHSFI